MARKRIEDKLQYHAIIHTLRQGYATLAKCDCPHRRAQAQAHIQGIVTGLLMSFSLPEVESFIKEAVS